MAQDHLTREVMKDLKKISEKEKKALDKEQKEWEDRPMVEKGKKRKKAK